MRINRYTGMDLSDPSALIEARAIYGGLQFSMGLCLLLCALELSKVTQGLTVSIFIFSWLAGARACGLSIDSTDNGYNFAAAISEACRGLIAVIALQADNRQFSA